MSDPARPRPAAVAAASLALLALVGCTGGDRPLGGPLDASHELVVPPPDVEPADDAVHWPTLQDVGLLDIAPVTRAMSAGDPGGLG